WSRRSAFPSRGSRPRAPWWCARPGRASASSRCRSTSASPTGGPPAITGRSWTACGSPARSPAPAWRCANEQDEHVSRHRRLPRDRPGDRRGPGRGRPARGLHLERGRGGGPRGRGGFRRSRPRLLARPPGPRPAGRPGGRGRAVPRAGRRAGQQRGHPPRIAPRPDLGRGLGRGDRHQPRRALPLLPRCAAGDDGAAARLDRERGLPLGAPWGGRAVGLRRLQGRHPRAHPIAGPRGGQTRGAGQRRRPWLRADRSDGGRAADRHRRPARRRVPAGRCAGGIGGRGGAVPPFRLVRFDHGPSDRGRRRGVGVKHPRWVLAISLALTLAAVVPALRFRIDTDLADLLPDGAPAADDYRLFLRTFGGFEKVFVIVRSPGRRLEGSGPLADAGERLAEALRGRRGVAEARAGITGEDEAFFLRRVAPRLPLLLPGDAHGSIRDELAPRLTPEAVHRRVAAMRQALRSPVGAAAAPFFTADPLGLSEGLLEDASAALPVDPLTGAFLARQGDAALVILTPSRAELDPAGGRAFLAELEKAYARVRRESDLPLDFQAVGGPIYAAQDEAILRQDLTRTATASAAGVAILLLLGFGGGFIPLVILASVAAGLVWTAAATALGLGRISVVGVGFAAALVGMGVEYGIHAGARYRQLRGEGQGAGGALAGTFRDPGPGIVSSALTTAAGLGALVLAHFRPLRELGQVLTLGTLVTLVTTATLGAALLLVFPESPRRLGPPRLWSRFGQPLLAGAVGLSAR